MTHVSKLLTDSIAALEARRVDEALARLVEAWRKLPAPALADAIDEVAARAEEGKVLPPAKTAKGRDAAWRAAAVKPDATTMGLLVATLLDTRGCNQTLERLELLTQLPPDPRLGAKVATMLRSPPYNASVSRTTKFWRGLFKMLPGLGDPRLLTLAGELVKTWRDDASLSEAERDLLRQRLDAIVPELAQRFAEEPELDVVCAALCARIPEALGARAANVVSAEQTEDELLQAVYREPDSDGPRLVYADWLQERSDARGELIVLQLERAAGRSNRAAGKREKELIALSGDRWLGGLLVQKGGRVFERGFLSACRANAIDDNPAWNLVHTIVGAVPQADGSFASLRSLLEITKLDGLANLTQPLGVTSLEFAGPYFKGPNWGEWGQTSIAAYRALRALPQLERVQLRGSNNWVRSYGTQPSLLTPMHMDWVWQGTQLTELMLPVAPQRFGEFRAALVDAGPRLRCLQLSTQGEANWPHGWQVAVGRGEAGTTLEIAAPPHSLGRTPSGGSFDEGWAALLEGVRAVGTSPFTAAAIDITLAKKVPAKSYQELLEVVRSGSAEVSFRPVPRIR